jgi:ATP-dependent RNA helicase SUPV3L1/SUV3
MLDPSQRWDVAVIDEVQMLQDPERGWAWTHALLGVAAETVIILGAPAAEPLVREIAARTGESLSVRHLARLGELTVLRAATALGDVPKNTAIVAFSRRAVLRIAQFLSEECHRKVAVIYGALSPEVRRREAARFRSGEADVVVTTDAIGMGLNLPVETILFWELEKYDGYGNRPLSAGEILQIAGRAGRFGLFPVGFVGVVAGGPSRGGLAILKHAVATALPAMRVRLPVSLTPEMAEQIVRPTGVRRLAVVGLLRHPQPDAPWDWSVPPSYFQTADCWPADPSASIRTQAAFAAAPANLPEDSNFLLSAALAIEQGGTMEFTHPRCHSLEELEKLWKSATLYLWLAIRWPQVFTDGREAAEMRDSCDHLISQMLKAGKIALRCRTCGRTLPHRHEFAICEQCYSARRYIDEDY